MNGMMVDEKSYDIRLLGAGDEKELQDLCERCHEFVLLTEGQMPGPKAGFDILNDLPPGKGIEDKRVFGVYDKELLVGVVEMVKDYKTVGEWIIGLLLVDPARRGMNLGGAIHDYIKDYVSLKGGTLLRIGVIEENARGMNFWKRLGYREIERKQQTFGKKDHTVIVMNLEI